MYTLEYSDSSRPLYEWLKRVGVEINDLLENPQTDQDLEDILENYQICYSVRAYEVLIRDIGELGLPGREGDGDDLDEEFLEAAKLPVIPLKEIIGGSLKWELNPETLHPKLIAFINRAPSMDWLRLEIRRACMELYVEHGNFKHFHNLVAHMIWNLNTWISPRALGRLGKGQDIEPKYISEDLLECANEVGQLGKYNFPVMLTLDEYWNTFGVGSHRFIIPFLIPTEDGYQRTYSQLMIDRHMRSGSFDKVMRGD